MNYINLILFFVVMVPCLLWLLFYFGRQNIPKNVDYFDLKKRDFYEVRFEKILHAFLTGNNSVLRFNHSIKNLQKELDKIDTFYRGFAYEGAGMGYGIRSTLSFNNGKKFERNINDLFSQHIYQYYVGLGWWLHIRYGNSPNGYNKWINQMKSKLAPVVFDGVGFRSGLFRTHHMPNFNVFNETQQRICYQGFGRSIWFTNRYNIDLVLQDLEGIDKRNLPDTFSGIGLAVAYSMFDDISLGLKIKEKIPHEFQSAFAQGMAFGWEARSLQNQYYWNTVLNEVSGEEKRIVEAAIKVVHDIRDCIQHVDKKDYYVRWMDLTRDRITAI
ncbi:DUF1702 family protein [Bacillus toyonensis]|uniref:DUF1702 family protein n=1 Tax=Bacillus toyonensis TaxID=155322 RepID=UPI000BF0CB22|nr:DUF1702 family protein [Bacillus toyonensis]PEM43192.1 hypothetical protein CN636_17210 [Bacillus toyonensis]